ncbi:uncharacterized protein LOC115958227 [Quercus lobata]|uniref:uncharacterized protein LOC115958227 n=1 Tax=Quercus lobata TaxID=97700 RepID=UPI001245ABBD|nr:uncharacterized protein LOC115958227 [Quercus lobata]
MVRVKVEQSLNEPPSLLGPVRVITKTKTPPARCSRTRSKPKTTPMTCQYEEEREEHEEEEEETSNNNSNDDVSDKVGPTVDVAVAQDVLGGGPLSRLREFHNSDPSNSSSSSSNLNQLDSAAREHYATAAESVKKLLLLELSSARDVETMVELSNKAFNSLDWLQPDYSEFYDAVKDVLSLRAQLSSVETKLRTHQNEESDAVSSRCDVEVRSKESMAALARSEAELGKAKERVSGLKRRVSEIMDILRKLVIESAKEERVLADIEKEWNQCLESHMAIKKEEKELTEQVEEKQKAVQKIKQLRDEVEAGVQASIKALSSLCQNNVGGDQ